MPGTTLDFDGIVAPGVTCFCAPPDTNGEVGLTQYVQMVNTGFQVFDKATGTSLLGPLDINTVWSGFGGFCAAERGLVAPDHPGPLEAGRLAVGPVAVEDATALPVDDAHRVGGVVEDRAEALALLRQGAPLHDARHQERDRGDADEGEGEVRGPHPREHRLAAHQADRALGDGQAAGLPR